MTYTFQLLATLLTIYIHTDLLMILSVYIRVHIFTHIYQLCTCLCALIFIFLHIIYISILATQSRYNGRRSQLVQFYCSSPPPAPFKLQLAIRIEIGILCGAQQPNHRWRAAALGSILCVLGWEFSLFCVLEYSREARVSHCRTRTHTWNVILAARILQHTHVHTHHTP